MSAKVMVLPLHVAKNIRPAKGLAVISTVSRATGWQRHLSPFVIGPCKLYRNFVSQNMENAWQYSKLYEEHAYPKGPDKGLPKPSWLEWAKEGWANPRAVRYPMGKGRKPLCSLWWDEEMKWYRILNYIEARKAIYAPLYTEAVQKTEGWLMLKQHYKEKEVLVLLDYDAYDHRKLGMTLTDVLNNPRRKMGHAFVLAMLLTRDKALKEIEFRSRPKK